MKQEAPQPLRGTRARRMHATLREVDLKLPSQHGRARLRLIGAIGGCALLAMALTLSVVLHTSSTWLDARVAAATERFGLDVDIEFVTYDLIDGLTLEGVSVHAPAPHDLSVVIDRATSDLSVIDIISGSARPRELTLQGVHAQGDVDDAALNWLKGFKAPGEDKPNAAPEGQWRGEIRVANGSAELKIDAHIEGLPRTGQTLSLRHWTGTLKRHAALQFDAEGSLRIDAQERKAKLALLTGPDAAFQVTLDDPIGLELSGLGAPLGLQVEGAQWSRRRGALQIDGLAIGHGERRLDIDHVRLDGGSFPWLGPHAPRSLTLERLTGDAAGHRVHIAGGSVTLAPPKLEDGQWLPLPREIRLEGIALDSEGAVLNAEAKRITLSMDQDKWQVALTDAPTRLVKSIDVQHPNVTLRLQGLGILEESATAAAVNAQDTMGTSTWRTLADSDKALVIPGASELIKELKGRRVSITRGNVIINEGGDHRQEGLRLDNLSVTWAPALEGGGTASVNANVSRNTKRSGRLDLTADVTRNGALRSANGAISGPGVAHVLSHLSDYVTVQPDAWVKADFVYEHRASSKERHRVSGEVRFEDFGFEAWRISHTPVVGLEGSLRYAGVVHPESNTLSLEVSGFQMAGARASGGVNIVLAEGAAPQVNANLTLPRQDCAQLARAIPPSLIPRLKGLELSGSLEANATFSVDLSDANSVTLDVDGAVADCRVVTLGGGIDLETLRAKFIHHPVEPKRGRRDDIEVGRGTQQWISMKQLPHYLKSAAVMTEDRAFHRHQGVRWDLIAKAIKMNLEQERFAYGGSTITQQLVKNLYLTREKTLSRKLEELVIAWELERRFDKDEILELYVNVIEYGPDIYGVRKAAHYYFGKPPWHLSPEESAFIMGLKPYPRAGHRQWQSQTLNAWWKKRVRNVVKASGQSVTSRAKLLRFRPPGASFWSGVSGTPISTSGEAPNPAP